jgi:hypothetical protein
MNNATQLGPFGHQLRDIAKASNAKADIDRWNDYAAAQTKKFKVEARAIKFSIPAADWFAASSFHGKR